MNGNVGGADGADGAGATVSVEDGGCGATDLNVGAVTFGKREATYDDTGARY
jgi:hypothetical protein